MPLVHIYLRRGMSREYLRSISDGVHQALVEAYGAPDDDKFQFVHELDENAFVYNNNYLDVHRTDDLVVVNVVAVDSRDLATKKKLYSTMVDILNKKAGLRKEDVLIYIISNKREEWSFGNGLASYAKG